MSVVRAILFLVIVVVLPALSQQPPESARSRNADLDRLRGEIRELRADLEQVRSRTRTAEEELQATELELAITTREMGIAVGTQARLEEEAAAVRAGIDEQSRRLEAQRKFLGKRLVMLYEMGGGGYLRLLLDLDPRRNPFEAMSMLSFLVTRDARAIKELRSAREELASRHGELAEKQSMIVEVRKLIEGRRAQAERSRIQKEVLLASLRSEGSVSARRLAGLEEKERRLERLFDLLYERKGVAGTGADIRTFQGALQWPARGRVVEEFGKVRSSKFSTFTASNGVTLRTAAGAAIHPVFEGRVLYAQWFKGYGNLVIVDHGNRIFTLYGNMKNSTVSVGDRTAATEPIGVVAEDESGKAGVLYFEVRQDNKPVNPRSWLR